MYTVHLVSYKKINSCKAIGEENARERKETPPAYCLTDKFEFVN